MPPTRLIFFQDEGGICQILAWLDDLPAKARAKCIVRMARLQEMGYEIRRPEADFLRDGIYELRIGFQGVNYRILYFFHGTAAVVLSHGIVKEAAVPPKEIDLAMRRRKLFERDPEGHTHRE